MARRTPATTPTSTPTDCETGPALPASGPAPALLGMLTAPEAPGRSRRWVSDAARYKQYGNAVCVPVISELTDAVHRAT